MVDCVLARGPPEVYGDVLDVVVRGDVEIVFGDNGEIEHPVTSDLVEHMVEKRNAGRKLGATAAVDRDADADVRLRGSTLDLRTSDGRFYRCIHGC